METPPRFDLTQAIAAWREELLQRPGLAPADAQELEGHLRESVVDFQQQGLDASAAFALASQRLGEPQAIATEFFHAEPGKVWRLRLWWMVLGVFFWSAWAAASNPLTNAIVNLIDLLLPGHTFSALSILRDWLRLSQLPLLLLLIYLAQSRRGRFLRALLSRLNSRWKMGLAAACLVPPLLAEEFQRGFSHWMAYDKFIFYSFDATPLLTLLVFTLFVSGLAPMSQSHAHRTVAPLPIWREAARWITFGLAFSFFVKDVDLFWRDSLLDWLDQAVASNTMVPSWGWSLIFAAGHFLCLVALMAPFAGDRPATLIAWVAGSWSRTAVATVVAYLAMMDSDYFHMLYRPDLPVWHWSPAERDPVRQLTHYIALAVLILLLAPNTHRLPAKRAIQ